MKVDQRQKGQSLVEFALILPIFLLLVVGFFDIGRAVFYYSSVTNAVREATRFAVVNREAMLAELQDQAEEEANGTCDGTIEDNPLKQKVLEYAFGLNEDLFDPCSDIQIDIKRTGEDNKFLNSVSIQYTVHYEPITPILSQIVGSIPLVAQSTMYVTPGSR